MTKVWDINSQEYRDEIAKIEKEAEKLEIYAEMDKLQEKWNRNEFRYKDEPTYEEYKLKYDKQLKELKSKLK